MRSVYVLLPLLAAVGVSADPILGFRPTVVVAPDPPPAGTSFPASADGVLQDNSKVTNVINLSPDLSDHPGLNCWTKPLGYESVTENFDSGKCSVCVVQRSGTDRADDYLLWARDDKNYAMGNMGQATFWALDDQMKPTKDLTKDLSAKTAVGGYDLVLSSLRSSTSSSYHEVRLAWAVPPFDSSDPHIFDNPAVPFANFDPATKTGTSCVDAGEALNGAVHYFICFFTR